MNNIDQELGQEIWEVWFYTEIGQIPEGRDSWRCHYHDALGTYLQGGEPYPHHGN
jgi:hypothetical protein